MIFEMNGSGGAAALNYKVVGGTAAPASPAENTIWVSTDTAITDHVFSPLQPEAVEGRVWLKTGASGEGFNALKKNAIQLYPMSAQQYVGGVWVKKTAQQYIGGAWTDWWSGHLFQPGEQFADITGGWDGIEADTQSIRVAYSAQQDYGASVTAATKNAIDFADFTVLTANVTEYNETFELRVKDAAGAVIASAAAAAAGEVKLNVADIPGAYFIELYAYASDHGSGSDSYVNVYFEVNEVRLE